MAEENKEEILANFQGITGIEDIGEAFSHLEETNWDLMAAIRRVMPQDDDIPPQPIAQPPAHLASTVGSRSPPMAANSIFHTPLTAGLNNFSNMVATSSSLGFNRNHRSHWDGESGSDYVRSAFAPVGAASTSASASIGSSGSASIAHAHDIIDLTSDIDLNPSTTTTSAAHNIKFNIHFNQQMYSLSMPASGTIGQLKTRIFELTGVQMCRQALRGWSPDKQQAAQYQSTKLCTLALAAENELVLVDMTGDGFMDYDNREDAANTEARTYQLNIVQQPSGRPIQLKFRGHTTVQEVKTSVFDVSDIPVRHQEWTGWPQNCDNNFTLEQTGIELTHNFTLQSGAERQEHSNNAASGSAAVVNATGLDSDSSAEEFEDATDFPPCEEVFTIQPQPRNLISKDTESELSGSTEFVQNYTQRYGEPRPDFFIGSLEEAIREAFQKPARERKLLAIYLHHGESITVHLFCDTIMKNEGTIQTFAENFVLYGWDFTIESNKNLFLSSITACIGDADTPRIRSLHIDRFPALVLLRKYRGSYDTLAVINSELRLDVFLASLHEKVEDYKASLQLEIEEERQRHERNKVKAEQDMEYQATLQADRAKDAERQRIESERAEEEARRNSIRQAAEQALPKEPEENASDITKIRVRKPTGDFLTRRFNAQDLLQDLLNFVTANGFLIEEYKLIGWPRRDLTSVDACQTLKALQLCPQIMVTLEER